MFQKCCNFYPNNFKFCAVKKNYNRLLILFFIAIIDIRNLFRQEKRTKAIKGMIVRDIKNRFGREAEEKYHKLARVSKSWGNNYIEYKNNGVWKKKLSV